MLTKVICGFQMEVIQESKNMVPDCERKLSVAKEDLASILVSPP